jgi:hypothetical protein
MGKRANVSDMPGGPTTDAVTDEEIEAIGKTLCIITFRFRLIWFNFVSFEILQLQLYVVLATIRLAIEKMRPLTFPRPAAQEWKQKLNSFANAVSD